MDSLGKILSDYKTSEPEEIEAIKKFVKDKYDSDVSVRLSNEHIIISAKSAALASAIRSNWTELTSAVKTTRKIILRIG